jgi:hypothetical protein
VRPSIVLFVLSGVLASPMMPIARAEIAPDEVRKAISQAVDYLKREQNPDGSWLKLVHIPGGATGLCALALLNAGVGPEDESMRRGLDYLRKLRLNNTYSVALQTMVLAKAEPKRDRALVAENVRFLERSQITTGPSAGAWSYSMPNPTDSGDHSNSQFALLALHEAERIGVSAKGQTWRLAKAYWEEAQNPDGSWGYKKGNPGTGSMTCAGIASLVIASGQVRQRDAIARGDTILCCQRDEADSDRIDRAMQWLGNNFQVTHNPLHGSPMTWHLYYLYGVERVGRLTAQRFIGGHDWYREGTDYLINHRYSVSDHWKGSPPAEDTEVIATSLALLYLSKGRRPVLVAKLKHGRDEDWNAHRTDVDNLTRYVESRWEQDLTWQVIDVRAATVDDLRQSPVLYFSGADSPLPGSAAGREDLARKLRDYLDREGFLFAEAYGRGAEFDKGFRELMALVFPEPEYRLRLLPPEHPIWRIEERVDPEKIRPLEGIDFGCRTSVVYAPPDASGKVRPSLSCLWELSRRPRGETYSPAVRAEVDAGMSIGINVLAYATNRELKYKDEIPRHLAKRAEGDSHRRGTILIANLRHPGGCRAAPRALSNLLEAASGELKIHADAEEHDLDISDEALFNYHLVFMHGRNAFSLTDGERAQLRTYVQRGGLVFANAICASKAFSESFRREMATIFPEHPLQPIPAQDALLSSDYGGYDLSTVTRRDPQRATANEPIKDLLRPVPPELEGIRMNDRYGVIFSPYDLSCALEKQNSLECQGYVREDAARIGLNVLLYSLQQ